jgi:hypothetical protein
MTDTTPIEMVDALVDRYLAAWNATDAAERRALIAATWTADATYVDPVAQSQRHDGVDAMIAGVQARFPGMRFTRIGTVDAHHDCVRFAWSLAPEGGEPLVKGTDFGLLRDGRLRAVTGFFDLLPQAA